MGEKTGIAWTDSTWNPVRGCTPVSAGCAHCYARTFAERWRGIPGHPFEQGFDVRLVPEALDLPLHWRKPRRIFVNSMSDLFHEAVPEDFIVGVFEVMARVPQHTYQVLTKRPDRMRRFMESWQRGELTGVLSGDRESTGYKTPLPNVWLGVSVEDQAAADERIPHLLATPAALRFLSCEPLLGPVSLQPTIDAWARQVASAVVNSRRLPSLPPRLGWVIIGGESGPGARPCDLAWIRSLLAQCRAAAVPAFVKQLGAFIQDRNDAGFDGDTVISWPMGTDVEHHQEDAGYQGAPVRVRLLDRKGGVVTEWPPDLRVQQFPEAR